jgi:ABC-2 type transport system ATP-binding protein
MQAEAPLLKIENLTKHYRDVLAVDRVSFDAVGGEITGLLGPNGAGKTTILRCVTGIITPSSGDAFVAGHSITNDEKAAKRACAFVPEVPNPYELLTVREHLQFVAMAYDRLDIFDKRAAELIERFDLVEKADSLVATLSKGMKQKLALACAFVHDAKVLLLDEPLIGIDPRGARELKDLLSEARAAGAAILVSTHMLDTAEHLCDRIVILNRGRKVAEGTLSDLHTSSKMSEQASLEDVFLRLTEEQVEIESAPVAES